MEHVAQYVAGHSGQGKTDVDGLDALMRAMEQLPAYLDRVASGGRDVPLALLPLLNDLRAVRGGALLSEGTLLMLNLHSDEPARPIATGPAGELARAGEAAAAALPERAARLDTRRERRSPAGGNVGNRRAVRDGVGQPASVPALVGRGLRPRGAAAARTRRQRIDQAAARAGRPRAASPAGHRRGALLPAAAARAAEQPALLRRPRRRRRDRASPACAARSGSTSCCRSTSGSTKRARRCRHRRCA